MIVAAVHYGFFQYGFSFFQYGFSFFHYGFSLSLLDSRQTTKKLNIILSLTDTYNIYTYISEGNIK